jgi:serine/threonine-protein kinase PpkA
VVDGRADLYSVGVLAYELLMGRLPYQASDPLALALMHAQDPVPRLPPEKKHWQPFLDRAMAKSPDNRYRNAQQMLSALNQIASGKPVEPMVDMGKVGAFFGARWKPMVSALAGVALVVVAVAWLQRDRPAEPESDFFTVQDSVPAAAVPAEATPAEPEAAAATPVDAALANAAQAPAPGVMAVPFAQVTAEVSVVPLDYDPTRIGARELAAARRQIDRQRLSLPPGDNAMQSLREARSATQGLPSSRCSSTTKGAMRW